MPGNRDYVALLAVAVASAAPAQAAQLTASFEARVRIETGCAVSAASLDFGNAGTIAGGETAAAAVTVVCSAGTPYTISFNPLLPVTVYSGRMINGPAHVDYSAALSAAGGVGPGTHTITGLLPPQPTPAFGIYTDNRTVYLSY
jgi:spore coat protein U-like protein